MSYFTLTQIFQLLRCPISAPLPSDGKAAEPKTYVQTLIHRVAQIGSARGAKTLIVSSSSQLQLMAKKVAHLKLQDTVEFLEATPADLGTGGLLDVETGVHAVLIAAANAHEMIKIGQLCAAYQAAGIPVVVIKGWPPPTTRKKLEADLMVPGHLTVPGMFDMAARYCRGGTTGDYLEFGSFQGFTLQCAFHAFARAAPGNTRRFISFDSFAGIDGATDAEGFANGAYAASETSFRFANDLSDVPNDRVVTVPGVYAKTLGDEVEQTRARLAPLEPIEAAVVHIDCDVEAPAKQALDFVTPYLKQGSLLLFDEYDLHQARNDMGERAALRAWLKENPAFEVEPYRTYHVAARSFIVHKK